MDHRIRTIAVLGVLALTASLWIAPPAVAQSAAEEFFQVIKEDDLPSNAEMAARLSEGTFQSSQRVIISRDDAFPDALASGLLQSESPLLMVPSVGRIPDRVVGEIRRLGASSAVILGGRAAVTEEVENQLRELGLAVERRQGSTRIDTAVEIARSDAPDADTAILVRADGDPGNPTQAFADALPAGAMSARNRWPVLLTNTGTLSAQTRDHLAASRIRRVLIMGGTAAVSAAVEAEVRALVGTTERIAGPSRFETAVEAAKVTGEDTAADADRVVLVDGTSPNAFAGGFASAGHAAAFDAPIVLTDGIMVPESTSAFLEPAAAFAQAGDETQVTCVVHPVACDISREELGLIDIPILDVTPSINSLVQPGQQVQLRLTPADEGANMPVTVKGSCLDGQQDIVTGADGTATFTLAQVLPPFSTCDVDITYGSAEAPLSQGYSYALVPGVARGDGVSISSEIFAYGAAAPTTPLYVADRIECTGQAGTVSSEDATYEAQWVYPDFYVASFGLTSFPLEAQPGDSCTATAQMPEGLTGQMWGVYSWADAGLRNPLVQGRGTTASFSFDDIGSVTDVNVVWILETHSADVTVPPSPPQGVQGQVFNADGLDITCDGVALEPGLNVRQDLVGATCQVGGIPAGSWALVVQAGLPLEPSSSVSFTIPADAFTTAVYTMAIDSSSQTGGQGGAAGCVNGGPIPTGAILSGLTTPQFPSAYGLFTGTSGEALRIRADNLRLFDHEGVLVEGTLDPVLRLYGPDGALVAENDDGDSRLNSRIDVTLPTSGEYCVEVTGFGGSAGDFLVAVDPAPVLFAEGVLSPEVPEEAFDLPLEAGVPVIIEMRAPGFEPTDPVTALFDSAGTEVAFSDDDGGPLNARIEFTPTYSDTYALVVTSYDESTQGAYTVEVSFDGGAAPAAFAAAGWDRTE